MDKANSLALGIQKLLKPVNGNGHAVARARASKPKRRLSAEGRAKIVAAQKKRWAKAKATKK
jgi:hypothetical protein